MRIERIERMEDLEKVREPIKCKDFAILSGSERTLIANDGTAKVNARLSILIFSTNEMKIVLIDPPRLLLKPEALNQMKDEVFASLWYDLKRNARQYEDISYVEFMHTLKQKYSHVSVI